MIKTLVGRVTCRVVTVEQNLRGNMVDRRCPKHKLPVYIPPGSWLTTYPDGSISSTSDRRLEELFREPVVHLQNCIVNQDSSITLRRPLTRGDIIELARVFDIKGV